MKNSKTKDKKRSVIKILIVLLSVIIFLLIACDNRMITRYYTVKSDKIDKSVRFAVIADLHSCSYGSKQSELLNEIAKNKPDAILLPGDIKDDILPDKSVKYLLDGISDSYPCYYVTGNHEVAKGIEQSTELFLSYGIDVLEGDCETVELNGQTIQICGTDDPLVSENIFNTQLKNAAHQADPKVFSVLLAHRPERISNYLN
jgi:predicted MPP superfamily phosphohydrolase